MSLLDLAVRQMQIMESLNASRLMQIETESDGAIFAMPVYYIHTFALYARNAECHTVEFKKSTEDITKDVYESICAFSNRDGGQVFLGVKDNGEILGIKQDCIEK